MWQDQIIILYSLGELLSYDPLSLSSPVLSGIFSVCFISARSSLREAFVLVSKPRKGCCDALHWADAEREKRDNVVVLLACLGDALWQPDPWTAAPRGILSTVDSSAPFRLPSVPLALVEEVRSRSLFLDVLFSGTVSGHQSHSSVSSSLLFCWCY